MPEPYRLKIKVGQHEFEAEGDPQVVHEQFQAFKELITAAPLQIAPQPQSEPMRDVPMALPAPLPHDGPPAILEYDKIMRLDDRVVSLTVRPANAEDAVLLLLLGQKFYRGNDSVTGAEIIGGLSTTGGLSVLRADRLLEKLARDGDVIIFGERRSKRYRLTNTGQNKARRLAAEAIASVA